MKIKKFTARTFSEALELVKRELSQDAVILETRERKGLRPHVEVTAAVDYDGDAVRSTDRGMGNGLPSGRPEDRAEREAAYYSQAARYQSEIRNPQSAVRNPPPAAIAVDNAADPLRSEINELRSMIESMKNSGYEVALPAKKRAVLAFLRERRIREEYALRLCDKTTDTAELPLLLSADIKVRREHGERKAVMLIGPTGVGKTTTIAKLAAREIKAGRKTAIVNLDAYRIGAAEQARIYARVLGIPLATASTHAEFRSSLRKFAAERDVVFIDTTGRNPRDESSLADMAEICGSDIPVELHLLMSASADEDTMIEAYRSYRRLPIDYIGFTKLDEAVRYGSLYNLLLTYQKPVAWLTTGQRVPGDIEQATVGRLAGLIMAKEC